MNAAELSTIARPWADDGGSRNGHDGRDLGRDVATVGHGKFAAELDGDGVFRDDVLLIRHHRTHALVV